MEDDWDEEVPSAAMPRLEAKTTSNVDVDWDVSPPSNQQKTNTTTVKGWDDDNGKDDWDSKPSAGFSGGINRDPRQSNNRFDNNSKNNDRQNNDRSSSWGNKENVTKNNYGSRQSGFSRPSNQNTDKQNSWSGDGRNTNNRQFNSKSNDDNWGESSHSKPNTRKNDNGDWDSAGPSRSNNRRNDDDDWGGGGQSRDNNRSSNQNNKRNDNNDWGGGGPSRNNNRDSIKNNRRNNDDDDCGGGGPSRSNNRGFQQNNRRNNDDDDDWGGGGQSRDNNRSSNQNNRRNDNDDWGRGGQSRNNNRGSNENNRRNNDDDDDCGGGGQSRSNNRGFQQNNRRNNDNDDDCGGGGPSRSNNRGFQQNNRRNNDDDDDWGGGGQSRDNNRSSNQNNRRNDNDDWGRGGQSRNNNRGSNENNRRNNDDDDDDDCGGGGQSRSNNRGFQQNNRKNNDDGWGGSNKNQNDEWGNSNAGSSGIGCGVKRGRSDNNNQDNGGNKRREDWNCSCGHSNFSFRKECQKCKASKPEGSGNFSNNDNSGGNKRSGDWSCKCGHSNFAFRKECQKCSESKPQKEGDEEGDPDKPKRVSYIPEELGDHELGNSCIRTGINFDNYDKIPVEVTGDQPVEPCTSFEDCKLATYLLDRIKECEYPRPTPIQKYAIPIIMAKRDIMACAQTGSGKTAAFLLPIINRLIKENVAVDIGRPNVLIMTPTRELAIQIYKQCRIFTTGSIIKSAIAYGGTEVRTQLAKIRQGCHILVVTPGRLNQFMNCGDVSFEEIKVLVLDEADRMLDMGFKVDIEKVAGHRTMPQPGDRQTLMFSATFPSEIQQLAGNYLSNYLFLRVGIIGSACENIKQVIYQVATFEKREKLMEILKEEDPEGTIVFVAKKINADFLASYLSEMQISSTSMHGARLQQQREEALREFTNGKRKILIATSVAARGLDIKGVQHVINYDLPNNIDEYVHRIGRTGRVGNSGRATSFYDSNTDIGIATGLSKILRDANQPIPDFLPNTSDDSAFNEDTFGAHDVREERSELPPAHGPVDDEEW